MEEKEREQHQPQGAGRMDHGGLKRQNPAGAFGGESAARSQKRQRLQEQSNE